MKRYMPTLLFAICSPLTGLAVNAPSDGEATPAGPKTIALNWNDNANDETGFEIEYDPGTGWTNLTTVALNEDHYYHRGLSAQTNISYRVRAIGTGSPSAWHDLGSATTTLQMNMVFFFADDMGYKDIVGLRNPAIDGPSIYETPALDALISESTVIDNAYCSGPRCVVARRTVLTGKYDWRPEAIPNSDWYLEHDNSTSSGGLFAGGISTNPATTGQTIPDNVTYAEAVTNAGYRTCYIGKYHLGQSDDQPGRGPNQQGFHVQIGSGHRGAPDANPINGLAYFPNPLTGLYETLSDVPYNMGTNTGLNVPAVSTNEYLTDRLTDEAIGFIGSSITNYSSQPFFLTLAHYAVHTPVEAKQADIDYFSARKSAMAAELATHPMAGTPLIKDYSSATRMIQDNRVYAAMMKSYDDSMASLRTYLATTDDPRNPGKKLSETTIIVVSSDHGGKSTTAYGSGAGPSKALENDATDPVNPNGSNAYSSYPTANYPFRQGKTWVYEGGLKIPLIIYYPGLTTSGQRSDALVHGADFFSTFVDMAGAAQNTNGTDSTSFMLSVARPQASARKDAHHFFTNANRGTANPAIAAYRKGDYKLLYFMVQRRLELYNLAADPYEQNDLAQSRPDLAQEMFKQVYQQHLSTGAKMPSPGSNSWDSEQDVLVDNAVISALPAVPNADPSGLLAQQISPTTIRLNWTVNADNATHSVIYRRADPAGETGYREHAFLPVGTTTFVDQNLEPLGKYRYRIQSENLGGWSTNDSGNAVLTLTNGAPSLSLQANTDSITTLPDEARSFDPLINDQGEGALQIIGISQPTVGNATFENKHILYQAPASFSGDGISMTYILQDEAAQLATGTVYITLPLPPADLDLGSWEFEDTPGTSLDAATSSSGLLFAGPTPLCSTDGTNLVLTTGGGATDLNKDSGVFGGGAITSGSVCLSYHIVGLDFSASATNGNSATAGFALRDKTENKNFGVLRIREQNDKLRLEIRTTGNNLLHEFDSLTLSNLSVTTTLDLDAGLFSSSMSTNGGIDWIALPDIISDPTALALDIIRFTSKQGPAVWTSPDFMSIDYVRVIKKAEPVGLYAAWITAQAWAGVLDQNPLDDADGDGFLNLYEFAMGLDPLTPEDDPLFDIHLVGLSPQIEFIPARDTGKLGYFIQYSKDLSDWSSIPEESISAPGGQLVQTPMPASLSTNGYARLKIAE